MIHFLYKCRLCGKIDDGFAAGSNDKSSASKHLVDSVFHPEKAQATMTQIHACNKQYTGISDLIGAEVRED